MIRVSYFTFVELYIILSMQSGARLPTDGPTLLLFLLTGKKGGEARERPYRVDQRDCAVVG